MPSLESQDSYAAACARLKERKAKLISKGIDPRSLKFLTLLYRRKP